MEITTHDFAFATTRLGDLVGNPYSGAFAREDRVAPFLHQVRGQHRLLYQEVEPVRELPAEAGIDALDDEGGLALVGLPGWPASIAGLYP